MKKLAFKTYADRGVVPPVGTPAGLPHKGKTPVKDSDHEAELLAQGYRVVTVTEERDGFQEYLDQFADYLTGDSAEDAKKAQQAKVKARRQAGQDLVIEITALMDLSEASTPELLSVDETMKQIGSDLQHGSLKLALGRLSDSSIVSQVPASLTDVFQFAKESVAKRIQELY